MALFLFFFGLPVTLQAEDDLQKKARSVAEAAIEAMGGDAYLQVKAVTGTGRYFHFKKERRGFTRFEDWTVYDPLLSRFRLGKGRNQFVQIVNLERNKGWILEGEDEVREMTEEELRNVRIAVKKDVDYLFRHRLDEEGMSLFYYGPNEIAVRGDRQLEAVEFLDATNHSVIIYFDRKTHLPVTVETTNTNPLGIRLKHEKELSNWHWIDGVQVPLNLRTFIEGEKSEEIFFETFQINPTLPPGHFSRPVIEK